jgi:hypothetical protein
MVLTGARQRAAFETMKMGSRELVKCVGHTDSWTSRAFEHLALGTETAFHTRMKTLACLVTLLGACTSVTAKDGFEGDPDRAST